MKTENISTLKIHKLSQAQYERELAAGNIDENALYFTPDTGGSSTGGGITEIPSEYITESELEAKGYLTTTSADSKYQPKGTYLTSVPSEYINETELQTHTDQVLSAGEQLVLNGSQALQNNYNFSQLKYDGSQANNSGGSLLSDAGKRHDVISDFFFTINPNRPLYASFDLKAELGSQTYAYVAFYDVDKQLISASHHMYQPNTLTRLTQDLKKGDTVVHLEDLTNWNENLTATHQRSFIFWNYTNSKGYTYPPETYSRNMYSSLYTDSSSIDKTNKTITLSTAWNRATIPAGTYLSQGSSGNNYKYLTGSRVTVTTEWKTFKGGYDGVDYTGKNDMYKLPPGTAFAKFGMFLNYGGVANEKVWITNIVVKEDVYSEVEKKADKTYVDTELAKKSDKSHTHSQYLTEIPNEYVTETELSAKGYLTEHQSLSAYSTTAQSDAKYQAKGNYLTSIPSEYVTDTEMNNKLKDLSTIEVSNSRPTQETVDVWVNPTASGEFVIPEINDSIISTVDTWSSKKISDELTNKANKTHIHEAREIDTTAIGTKDLGGLNLADTLVEIEALLNSKTSFSGSYNDLTNKPPTCNVAYANCETAAATAEKVVTVLGDDEWTLEAGRVVMVYFTTSNSASNVKLNVNGTGAYPIWYNNKEYTSTGTAYTGYAKRVINYMFNGTHWVWVGASYDSNTTYTNVALGQGYVTCATAEATTAKVGTLASYALTLGGIVAVKFTYAVPANATLNINSKGAKNMFYRGAKITAGVIGAGDIATFIYDGTQYQLLTIDRLQNDVDLSNYYTKPQIDNMELITLDEIDAICGDDIQVATDEGVVF